MTTKTPDTDPNKVIKSLLPAGLFEGSEQTCHKNGGGVSKFNSEEGRLKSEIARKRGGGSQQNNFGKGMRK